MSKVCNIGGQAVMEGVMMKAPEGIALAVRTSDGAIITKYVKKSTKAKKGTFYGLPVVRGVVAFVESLTIGMETLTDSAKLAGESFDEEPSRFEKWLSKTLGKSIENVVLGLAAVLAVCLSVGLFFVLPTVLSSLIIGKAEVVGVVKSLIEGLVRLCIFIAYILACSKIPDVRRVFMYHGAEHKTIACYEAEEEITVKNAMHHKRLHPRCGTNYLFLVMAVSILFFAAVGWNSNFFLRILTRIVFLPLVAGLSYEVLRFAAKYDNVFTRIIRAPGMGLQYITTKEPTADMLEVAISAFNLAMNGPANKWTNPAPEPEAEPVAEAVAEPAEQAEPVAEAEAAMDCDKNQ